MKDLEFSKEKKPKEWLRLVNYVYSVNGPVCVDLKTVIIIKSKVSWSHLSGKHCDSFM